MKHDPLHQTELVARRRIGVRRIRRAFDLRTYRTAFGVVRYIQHDLFVAATAEGPVTCASDLYDYLDRHVNKTGKAEL